MTTTPPPLNASLSVPPSTPIHARNTTTGRFQPKYENRNLALAHLANEMAPFFVGPVDVHDFFDLFLPPSLALSSVPFTKGMFQSVIKNLKGKKKSELQAYDEFVSSDPRPFHLFLGLIQPFQIRTVSPHVPDLTIVKTSHATDKALNNLFPFKLQPDCSVYPKGKSVDGLDLSRVDFVNEFKCSAQEGTADPFTDVPPASQSPPPPDSEEFNPFACLEGRKREYLGQLTAYATSILGAQYRTHVFMVLIFSKNARLIRWDRAGAVVTEIIPFDDAPYLLDFLIRYNNADAVVRGHDTTVGPPDPNDITSAKAIVPELTNAKSFLLVTIEYEQTPHRYIICSPEPRPDIPVGRWTRSSFAYDIQNRRRVLLKDSWRVILDNIEPEGEIYKWLRDGKVPNIPSYKLSMDIGDDTHKSRTQGTINKVKGNVAHWKLVPHRHYRHCKVQRY
jgi:hypothetical protein